MPVQFDRRRYLPLRATPRIVNMDTVKHILKVAKECLLDGYEIVVTQIEAHPRITFWVGSAVCVVAILK